MRIGLLLPNSNYVPRLAKDIRQWIDIGLSEGGSTSHELFIETTTYNESKNLVRSALQDLLIKQDVDVVVAPLNPAMAADVEDLMGGQEVPLIMLNMGEDIGVGDTAPPWVFSNSFNLWRSSWLMGQMAV